MSHADLALPLTPLALVEVRGADAEGFLQGQLSNDVRKVSQVRAQLSSYNSPKGRMLAVLHLLRVGDALVLEMPRNLIEPVVKRLRMYVMRSKVTLAESPLALFGLAGPGAADRLQQLGLPVPVEPLDCATRDGATVMRRLGDTPRYSVALPRERLPSATTGTLDDWRRLDIEAGVPTVHPETQDRFVAQMCNLDQLGGISFDKGCYTGQEIIARVHYRGAVKRQMKTVRLDGGAPAPGSKLESGEVVDAVAHPSGGSLALVVGS